MRDLLLMQPQCCKIYTIFILLDYSCESFFLMPMTPGSSVRRLWRTALCRTADESICNSKLKRRKSWRWILGRRGTAALPIQSASWVLKWTDTGVWVSIVTCEINCCRDSWAEWTWQNKNIKSTGAFHMNRSRDCFCCELWMCDLSRPWNMTVRTQRLKSCCCHH